MEVKTKKINLILTYIITIIMILDCNSIFITGSHFQLFNRISIIAMLISVGILIYNSHPSRLAWRHYAVIGMIITIYVMIYALFSHYQRFPSDIKLVLSILLKFLIIFSLVELLYKTQTFPSIFASYINVIFIIALISIFFWIFGSYLHWIHPTGKYWSNWAHYSIKRYNYKPSYLNIYFETQVLKGVIRNSAIFAEAPMASLTFSIGLTLENLFGKQNKYHKLKSTVLILAILTTLSSTGYICIIINLVYLLLLKTHNTKYSSLIIGILLFIGVIVIGGIIIEKLHSHSGSSRSKDYRNAFLVVKKYPIFGVGFGNGLKFKDGIGKFGYSNSFGRILGEGGLYMSILYWLPFIKSFIVALKDKNLQRLFFAVIVTFLFVTTIFVNSYLMYFLLAFLAFWKPRRKMELVENEDKIYPI